MATVYSRIIHLQEEEKIPFRFHPFCTTKIGRMAKEKWFENNQAHPPLVSSVEKHGTYLVFDYPDEFTFVIDSLIGDYVQFVVEKSKRTKQQEEATKKPLLSTCLANAQQVPEKAVPRKRKRLPFHREKYKASN